MKTLVAYDGSTRADSAIDGLKRGGLPREGEALIICVGGEGWPPTTGGTAGEEEGLINSWKSGLCEAEKLTEGACVRFRSHFPGWSITSEALLGSPMKAILNTADWKFAGSHRPRFPKRKKDKGPEKELAMARKNIERLEREVAELNQERDLVKNRVESLLDSLSEITEESVV